MALRKEMTGRTLVAFSVGADGVIQEPGVERSSGHEVLDRASLAHLRACIRSFDATRQPQLPPGRFALPLVWRIE